MTSDPLVFGIGPWRRAFLFGALSLFLALALVLWFSAEDESSRTAGTVLAIIIAVCLVGAQWVVRRTYVALTQDGIELHQIGMQIRAAWRDVEALSVRRGREGFVLRAQLEGSGATRLAMLHGLTVGGTALYDEEQRALIQERRFIPIEAFAWHARRGTLVADVKRLAPHVRIDAAQFLPRH